MKVTHKLFFTTLISVIHCFSGESQQASLSVENGKPISIGALVPQQVDEIEGMVMGPFVKLDNGNILTVDGTDCIISNDNGKTWERRPVFEQPEKFLISDERAILKTSNGVIILAFMNLKERANWNWQEAISDSPGARLPTYTVRSLDGGNTWQDVQKLHNEWTGAIRDMIETENGNVVFTSMMMRHYPGHHTVLTYKSGNEGKTWERSNIIDLGGIGHHSGVTEATIESLEKGELWLLMRTNWGTFWEAFSMDDGKTWENIRPTNIEASSAPGMLKRLQSGRLILVWNRRFPEGTREYPLSGGDNQWSEVAASNHREELSIAFSDDEGHTWSDPRVIAKIDSLRKMDPPLRRISYPYVFEINPGELWITTMQGGLRVTLREDDFIL
ncbi:sialidase family protein [Cyclobacterium jeungdonense]|uniref:Sialidase family protein n=1 Tax=Cyclobacterium jeungdonense TaxID=708087 RepID=A0ABT8C5J4_9BACT|nr:sialidase family protein [Cyclobacterium jeungdonense]MDN3687063.1 sialidase family protein [Cyclobacterium jeungdonense]